MDARPLKEREGANPMAEANGSKSLDKENNLGCAAYWSRRPTHLLFTFKPPTRMETAK